MKDSLFPICVFLSFITLPIAIRLKYYFLGREVNMKNVTISCFLDAFLVIALISLLGLKYGLVKTFALFYIISSAMHFYGLSRFCAVDSVFAFVVPVTIPAGMYVAGQIGYFFLSFLKLG